MVIHLHFKMREKVEPDTAEQDRTSYDNLKCLMSGTLVNAFPVPSAILWSTKQQACLGKEYSSWPHRCTSKIWCFWYDYKWTQTVM